jgi:hypothetical protein
MKLLIVFSMLSLFSAHVIASQDKVMVGENASGYARCMADLADCTTGCAKSCTEIYGSQVSENKDAATKATKHRKGSAGKQ